MAPILCLALPAASTGCRAAGPTLPAPAAPAGPHPSPAADRFAVWLAAFNAGDRDALLACHQQQFTPQGPGVAIAHADRDLFLSRQIGGLEPARREQDTETRVVVILKDRRGEHFARAVVEVQGGDPHLITHFELKPIPPPDDLAVPAPGPGVPARLDAAMRRHVIEGIARELRAHYVFPDVAEKVISALDDAVARGAFNALDRGPTFADAVGKLLRDVSRDGHLRVLFGAAPPPFNAEGQRQADVALAKNLSFGFGPVERLDGNVAKVVIFAFLPTELVRDAIADIMTGVADADALIIDLRENHGGRPATVTQVASYLFDSPRVHLNDMFRRDDNSTVEFWTLTDVPGRRFGGKKPLYVLTSKRTFSGGEELAYDLKCLGRALLIGETTGGGANPAGPPVELGDGFRIFVPWGRPINPITKTNWEGVGVVPDVAVPADDALAEAHRRALRDIATQRRSGPAQPPGG